MSIPGSAEPLLLAQQDTGGYQIQRSLRFNSSDSAYLSRTPASAGNRKTWTWAGWVKRSRFGTTQSLFSSNGSNDNTLFQFEFSSGDALRLAGSVTEWAVTSSIYRDPSAWYHIVLATDTTQATASNRFKIWVNGVLVSQYSTTNYPTQNQDLGVNDVRAHYIGAYFNTSPDLNGYLADVHFIDGQALTPSSFTEVSATTGQLIPKKYSGSFGTNGFRLDFSDNSAATATTLGKDRAGSNNWTPNNLSVTAGAGNDSLVDTPTSYGTGNSGGDVRGNYCTWNPLNLAGGALSNGNLELTNTAGGRKVGTIGVSSGKWYWEVLVTSGGDGMIGIMPPSNPANTATGNFIAGASAEYGYYSSNGQRYNNGSATAYGATFTTGDLIGVALDLDAGTLVFYKNGVSQGTAFTGLSGTFAPGASAGGSSGASMTANFGQRPFAYTAPSGFKALCDTNLPAPVVAKGSSAFNTLLYTGNGTARSITGLDFNPDLVWIKNRTNATQWHVLTDSVRGVTKNLYSNDTAAEETYTDRLQSFDAAGFSLGAANSGGVNTNTQPYVAWCWDAGASTVTNTSGSISSQVRANASAGFSIVTYTGNGSASATVGHGLGVAPAFWIIKQRSGPARNWQAYHSSLGTSKALLLNGTNAVITDANASSSVAPTSTVFTVQTDGSGWDNTSQNYVAYCFAPVAGYSSFGSYTGNGSADGSFVFCNFRPRWILVKNTASSTSDWFMWDTARSAFNTVQATLFANLSIAEQPTYISGIDVLSNGFKLRDSAGGWNGNGQSIIYAAFAESPFQYARAR